MLEIEANSSQAENLLFTLLAELQSSLANPVLHELYSA